MPFAYDPSDYWAVVFARVGSVFPQIIARSLGLLCFAGMVCVLQHFYPDQMAGAGGNHMVLPFQMVVAIMVAFRLNDAFRKYESANETMLKLHSTARRLVNLMCAYAERTPEADAMCEDMRRWIVLAAVMVKKHARFEKAQARGMGALRK